MFQLVCIYMTSTNVNRLFEHKMFVGDREEQIDLGCNKMCILVVEY